MRRKYHHLSGSQRTRRTGPKGPSLYSLFPDLILNSVREGLDERFDVHVQPRCRSMYGRSVSHLRRVHGWNVRRRLSVHALPVEHILSARGRGPCGLGRRLRFRSRRGLLGDPRHQCLADSPHSLSASKATVASATANKNYALPEAFAPCASQPRGASLTIAKSP